MSFEPCKGHFMGGDGRYFRPHLEFGNVEPFEQATGKRQANCPRIWAISSMPTWLSQCLACCLDWPDVQHATQVTVQTYAASQTFHRELLDLSCIYWKKGKIFQGKIFRSLPNVEYALQIKNEDSFFPTWSSCTQKYYHCDSLLWFTASFRNLYSICTP